MSVLLKYCGPKCIEKSETSRVIVDVIAIIGFFCANNKKNQVSYNLFTLKTFSRYLQNCTEINDESLVLFLYNTCSNSCNF